MSAGDELIVLRNELGEGRLRALATDEGWSLVDETTRAHLELASRRWRTRDGIDITYVADHPGGAHSLRVQGNGAGSLARLLRAQLPTHTGDELLAVVLEGDEPDPVACVRVASKLAACRPAEPDARHLAALSRLLEHPETAVRRAGIRSAYGCRWAQLLDVVRRRRSHETRLAAQLEHLQLYLEEQTDGPG